MANAKKIISEQLAADFEEYKNSASKDDIVRFYWVKKRSVLDQSVESVDMRNSLQELTRQVGERFPIRDTQLRFLSYAAKKLKISSYTKTLTLVGQSDLTKSPYMIEVKKGKQLNFIKMIAHQGFEILNDRTEFNQQDFDMNAPENKANFFDAKGKFSNYDAELQPIFDKIISEISNQKAAL